MKFIDRICHFVGRGGDFRVDLNTKTLIVGRRKLIKNGIPLNPRWLEEPVSTDRAMLEIFSAYGAYHNSIPTKKSSSRHASFRALSDKDLSDSDIISATFRDVPQARLEITALIRILDGSITWNRSWGSWFWKSRLLPDLVLLRDWVE